MVVHDSALRPRTGRSGALTHTGKPCGQIGMSAIQSAKNGDTLNKMAYTYPRTRKMWHG